MEAALIAAVLVLSVAVSVLAMSVPFVVMYYLRLDSRLNEGAAKVQQQIENLDYAVSQILERLGIPAEEEEK